MGELSLLLTDGQAEAIRRRELSEGVNDDDRVLLAYHDELARRRAAAEHDRETLTPIENAFEAVGGDLVDEVLGLRAEVERLQVKFDDAAIAVASLTHERDDALAEVERLRGLVLRMQPYVPEHVLDSLARLTALAREDGAP